MHPVAYEKVRVDGEWIAWHEFWKRRDEVPDGCDDKKSCPLSHRHGRDTHVPQHDSKMMQVPWTKEPRSMVAIDSGIAGLIGSVWNNGIPTSMSCENNVPKGFVWISFPGTKSAGKFMEILLKQFSDDKRLMKRVVAKSSDAVDRHLNWEHTYYISSSNKPMKSLFGWRNKRVGLGWWHSNSNLYTRELRSDRKACITEVSIRFPHHDFSRVLEAFQK